MEAYYKLESLAGTGYAYPAKFFKGETELIIDFSNLIGITYPIIKIEIDFNDGSPMFVSEFSHTETNKLELTQIKHKYYPDSETYNLMYYPTIYVTNLIFSKFAYQMPIRISKESFYSNYENLTVASTQFVDNSANSLFLILDTAKGDNLNLIVK